jgi:signal transduction histidine kinase
LIPRVDESVLDDLAQGPEHRALLEAAQLHALMIVPMIARDRLLGVLTVSSMRPDREYSEADLAFLTELAKRSAVQIDNARLFEAAEVAIRAREDTLAMVAHDLRSPLGTIKLGAKLLTAAPPDGERIATTAKIIGTASDRMNHLVDELLDAAFFEAGALALHRRPVAAEQLVDDCVLANWTSAASKGVRLLKKSPPGVEVLADRERLLQALDNLVGNALKFTPPDGEVEVRAERTDGDVVFSVSDTGPGIPEGMIPHLFERYWKGPRANGHGLGLFIAEAIVEAHGGRIEVGSHVGEGSTFRFSLPRSARPVDQPHPPP